MEKEFNIEKLKQLAKNFRKEILEVITGAGSGHPGGSLSCVEVLITLYSYKMKYDPKNILLQERDRLIISKGHASAAAYVTLANFGYFPKEELRKYRKLDAMLQGHVQKDVPGIEFSTGSLGQGLSFANGLALSAKIKKENFRVYCLLGDGELQEGSVWEAAMTASQHKLDNVCAIIDCNKVQQNGPVRDIKNEEPLSEKWKSFGWYFIEIDGHNFNELKNALDIIGTIKEKPCIIKANTVKGKGVSFMEGNSKWHGKAPNKEELTKALKELGF